MRILTIVSLSLSILALSGAIWLFAHTPRFAYVETAVILQNFNPAKVVRAQYERETAEWKAELKRIEDTVKAVVEEIKLAGGNKSRINELREKLSARSNDYVRYKKTNEERMVERERELMQPVVAKINEFLKEWGDRKGYSMIFGTTSTGNLVQARASLDITKEVLEALNRKYKE